MPFQVIVERENGQFVTYVPALEFASTYGSTREQALQRTQELIAGYLEAATKEGLRVEVPVGDRKAELIEIAIPASLIRDRSTRRSSSRRGEESTEVSQSAVFRPHELHRYDTPARPTQVMMRPSHVGKFKTVSIERAEEFATRYAWYARHANRPRCALRVSFDRFR